MKCKHCKSGLPKDHPIVGFCDDSCEQAYFKLKQDKINNRRLSKLKMTQEYGVSEVKEQADKRHWCTAHDGCFRCDVKHEKPAHFITQFRLWVKYTREGYTVFCNLILKDGSKPDLIIVGHGEIFIVEVIMSESEESIEEKRKKYPWPIKVVKATLDIGC